jgi:hypothetical protein
MSIYDKLNQAKTLIDEVIADMSIPSTPAPTPTPSPTTQPSVIALLNGTQPTTYTIPAGDATPSGGISNPGYQRRIDNMTDGSVIVHGDSILQATSENLVHPYAINFGLAAQSVRRLSNSLKSMSWMNDRCGAGVMMCGVNDLGNTSAYGARSNGTAVATLLQVIYPGLANFYTGKWVICHLLPTTAAVSVAVDYKNQIQAVNAGLATAFSSSNAQIGFCTVPTEMLDANGFLKTEMAIADGQHLSKLGSEILANAIRQSLINLGV